MYLAVSRINGKPYYSICKCVRKDGKPKTIVVKYIGNTEALLARLLSRRDPNLRAAYEFGASMSLFRIAEEIKLIETVNGVCDKPIGDVLTIQAINRVVDPTSKNRLLDWYNHSFLSRYLPVKKNILKSYNLCRILDTIIENKQELDIAIAKQMTSILDLDVESLIYDTTSTYLYVDEHEDSLLPRYGYSRDKRPDLRQVNLFLLITRKDSIPLLHSVYPGNVNDMSKFKNSLEQITDSYHQFCDQVNKLILVFDKGNVSKDNIKNIQTHFISSLKSSIWDRFQYEVKLNKKYKDLTYGSTVTELFGSNRKVVVYLNKEVRKKKLKSLDKRIDKVTEKLKSLKARNQDRLTFKAYDLLRRYSVKTLFKVWVREGKLLWELQVDRLKKKKERLGITILFTDLLDELDESIIEMYNSKSTIEDKFRILKGPIRIRPIYHRKDERIEAHIYVCFVGLILYSLLAKKLKKTGYVFIDKMKDLIAVEVVDGKETRFSLVNESGRKQMIDKLNLKQYTQI